MIIKKLQLGNYGALKNATINFQKGFNILSGANGQGKSHIIRALAYLILNYNQGKIEDDCNWDSDNFSIKTELEHNQNTFEINNSYSRKSGSSKSMVITDSDGNKEAYDTNKDVTDMLSTYFDPTYCKPALVAFQGEMDIVDATPAERRENLKKIYDLSFTKEIESLNNEIENLQTEKQKLEQNVAVLENKNYNFQQERPLNDTKEGIEQKKKDKESLQNKINSIEQEIKNYELSLSAIKKLEDDIQYFQNEKDKKEKKQKEIYTRIDEAKKIVDNPDSTRIESIQNELDEISLERISSEFDTTEADQLKETLYKKKNELDNTKEYIDLIENGKCPTCGNDFSGINVKEYTDKRDLLEKETREIFDKIKDLQNSYREWKKKFDINEENKKKKSQLEQSLQYEKQKLDDVIESNKKIIVEKEEENASLLTEITTTILKIEELSKEKENKEKELPDNKPEKNDDDIIKLKKIEDHISKYNSDVEFNQWVKEENKKIEQQKIDDKQVLSILKRDVDSKNTEIENHKVAVNILKKDFPNYVINSLKEEIEFGMNDVLDKAYEGRYHIQIKEKKNGLTITYGNDKEIKLASGAEKNLFTIGFKNSFSKIAGLKVLLLDEVDNYMDSDIATQTYKAVNELIEKGDLNQVIIITHKDEVKQLLEADFGAKKFIIEKGTVLEES